MTKASQARIARLYTKTVGYDPVAEGGCAMDALDVLRTYRANGWHDFNPKQATH